MMLICVACYCFPVLSAQIQGPEAANGSQFKASEEKIGRLRLGLTEKELRKHIACKPRKGREVFEGATGEYVQDWKYPECGIVLKMGSERKGGPKVVESIRVTAPSTLATSRGIRIGSTEREVVHAYGRFRDPQEPANKGSRFVAGSVYDGLIFDLRAGRVVRMFLGAAAE
jgi:hypothetical protein